jgi:hypothetical protein
MGCCCLIVLSPVADDFVPEQLVPTIARISNQ